MCWQDAGEKLPCQGTRSVFVYSPLSPPASSSPLSSARLSSPPLSSPVFWSAAVPSPSSSFTSSPSSPEGSSTLSLSPGPSSSSMFGYLNNVFASACCLVGGFRALLESRASTCVGLIARATVKILSERQSRRGRNFLIVVGTLSLTSGTVNQ